jgi:hypothetical protein
MHIHRNVDPLQYGFGERNRRGKSGECLRDPLAGDIDHEIDLVRRNAKRRHEVNDIPERPQHDATF